VKFWGFLSEFEQSNMSFITLGSPSRVRIGTCHICLYLLVYGISARRWERDAHCPRRISTLELLIDFTDG